MVVSAAGKLRFECSCPPFTKKAFQPLGITTYSLSRILTTDHNNCVHVMDQDSHLLLYFDNCSLQGPSDLYVDSRDNLFVAELNTEKNENSILQVRSSCLFVSKVTVFLLNLKKYYSYMTCSIYWIHVYISTMQVYTIFSSCTCVYTIVWRSHECIDAWNTCMYCKKNESCLGEKWNFSQCVVLRKCKTNLFLCNYHQCS